MYAIVDVKDKQFKVRENDTLYVPYHAEADVDDTLTLDQVLLLSDGEGDVTLGTPTVEDASVVARVVDQVQGDKVLVFKKKRRKRYRVKRGHRQQYTQIEITALHTGNGAPADDDTPAEEDTAPDAEAGEADVTSDDAVAEDTTDETAVETEETPPADEATAETDADDASIDEEAPSAETSDEETPAEDESDDEEDTDEKSAS
jgi:large subunit ribosomal protein L21